MKTFLLTDLTEYQKTLLTRLAYLNINFAKFQEYKERQDSITISDLKHLILNPDELYLGSLGLPQLKIAMTNVDTTTLELIEKLECAELGNLEIIDFADNKKTGFNGICFKDSMQNVGFSFRGTDLKTFSSLAADGLADIKAFLTNNTEQLHEAQELFAQYQNPYGQNFLYGHSLGGFLAENIYLQNYENISNAFVINPLHVNSQLLDSQAKIAAFNNPQQFSCFVTGGDYVSSINTPDLFSDNVHYVENSNEIVNNPIANHLIEAGLFDENENFVRCPKENAFEGHSSPVAPAIIGFINNERIKRFFSKAFSAPKNWLSNTKLRLAKIFQKKKNSSEEMSQEVNPGNSSSLQERLDPNNYNNDKNCPSAPATTEQSKSSSISHSTPGEDFTH